MAAVAAAVATGRVTPSEAAEIAKVLDAHVKAWRTRPPNWTNVSRALNG
jgi:hypothetical protein